MLKKQNRLTDKFQFNVVKKYGNKHFFEFFNATVVKPLNYEGPVKVGFVVPNTLSKRAAVRNRIKRVLRETFMRALAKLPTNTWIAVFANNKIMNKKYDEISDQVDRFIQKISVSH